MNLAVAVTHNNDGFFCEIEKQVVSGLRHLAHMTRIEPTLVQDFVEFLAVHEMGAVEIAIHGETGPQSLRRGFFGQPSRRIVHFGSDEIHVNPAQKSAAGVWRRRGGSQAGPSMTAQRASSRVQCCSRL